jgi:hypothetical protein
MSSLIPNLESLRSKIPPLDTEASDTRYFLSKIDNAESREAVFSTFKGIIDNWLSDEEEG